ncbi:MAG: prephenate dehydrogenase dimerization domain-containing protein, partial [Phycisphaeraceae bacterium]|nr:prephenate dehydrogenase dimerization domain-containing protein [Phycisphaeraceae bacterium]
DESTALFSHLPHLVAAMLVDAADGSEGWEVASTGFRDTTRLASSNPPMRRDIVLDNREPLLSAIERFETQLKHFKEALGSSDGPRILELFERARDVRDRWMNRPSGG